VWTACETRFGKGSAASWAATARGRCACTLTAARKPPTCQPGLTRAPRRAQFFKNFLRSRNDTLQLPLQMQLALFLEKNGVSRPVLELLRRVGVVVDNKAVDRKLDKLKDQFDLAALVAQKAGMSCVCVTPPSVARACA